MNPETSCTRISVSSGSIYDDELTLNLDHLIKGVGRSSSKLPPS